MVSGAMSDRRDNNDDDDDDEEDVCSIFTSSIEAHPYGVLPGGNRFITTTTTNNNNNTRDDSQYTNNTNVFSRLDNDEVWQDVLSFCNGETLSRVVQTCRRFYVMGHTPELWRDLVLRLQRDLIHMGPSWKDTYIQMMMMNNTNYNMNNNDDAATATPSTNPPLLPHRPIPMSGVYSDYLFRSHMCRSFSIPSHWLSVNDDDDDNQQQQQKYAGVNKIPRVQHLSTREFLEQYEQTNRPVVLAGAAKTWPATQKWADPDYFRQFQHQQQQQHPDQSNIDNNNNKSTTTTTTYRATSGAAPLPAQFTLPAYLDYCHWDYLEEAPLYLFDRTALVPYQTSVDDDHTNTAATTATTNATPCVTTLQDDYLPSFQATLPFWDPAQCTNNGGHDLFQYLGEGKRPDHTWLIVGPHRSGSVFHIDPNATHAWNANIVGRKRWIFYPPGMSPPGVYPSDDGDHVTLPLSIGEWLINYYETEHAAAMRQQAAGSNKQRKNNNNKNGDDSYYPMECTVEAGDVMFVPHGWWHMVINLEDGMNVAITHNYVSCSNLPNVLKFLQQQPDQISGCRDRPESIKSEHLYSALVTVLQQERHSDNWLQAALAIPDWTCRAWKSNDSTTMSTTSKNKVTTMTICRRRKRKASNSKRQGRKEHQQRKSLSSNGHSCYESRKRPHDGLVETKNGDNVTTTGDENDNHNKGVHIDNSADTNTAAATAPAVTEFRFSFL